MVVYFVLSIKMVPSHAIQLKTRATADDAFKEFDLSNAESIRNAVGQMACPQAFIGPLETQLRYCRRTVEQISRSFR